MSTELRERRQSRRAALLAAGSALVVAGCGGDSGQAVEASVSGENILGDPNAPVTIIEYGSPTCAHCKAFHDEVFAELKARYIDPGKVCFVFREIPTNPGPLSMAGFLTASCAPNGKYFEVLDVLFERQIPLVQAYQAGTARDELLHIAQAAGITEQQFDSCLMDVAEIERIQQVGEDAVRVHDLTGTPTFVINGEVYPAMSIEQLAAIIDPLLTTAG